MGRYARFRAAIIRKGRRLLHGAHYPAEHYPAEPLVSAAPNLGHDTDSYSSAWAYLVDLWSRALTVALSGRLMRDDVTVSAGHAHDDYRTELEWREIVRWRPLGDNQGTSGPAASKGLLYVTSTSSLDALDGMVHVDDQHTSLDLYARVAQPAPGATGSPDGWLEIKAQLYDLNTDPTVVVRTTTGLSIESKSGGIQHPDRWLGPASVYIGDCAVVRGQRWILLKIQVRVRAAGTKGGLYEVLLAKQRR